MRSIETMPVVAALGWTLIDFVWQGAIVALFLAIVKAALKNRTANLRYLASCAAMLLMLALPLITFVTLSSGVAETPLVTPGPAPGISSLKSKLGAGSPLAGEWIQATTPAAKNLRDVFSGFAPWLGTVTQQVCSLTSGSSDWQGFVARFGSFVLFEFWNRRWFRFRP